MSQTDAVAKTELTMQLPDGRTLSYADYGSSEGKVLIYCHGYPGSRFEASALDGYGKRANIRVLSLDRPGMGRSSFQAGRSFLGWPADVVALADHLQIERFAVLGVSGGSPYALACAAKIPERLISCGIVSGLGPIELGTAGMNANNRLIFFLARRFPSLLTPIMKTMAHSFRDPEKAKKAMTKAVKKMVKPDREALLASGAMEALLASNVEAYHQGVKGAVYEGGLYGRNWGFHLEDLAFQPLYLWHGELDTNVAVAMARAVAGKLPHCNATFYPDDAHVSVPLKHQEEIVSALFSLLS